MHAYLRIFDDAWSHDWESMGAVLDGVTEEEARYQAPCYAGEEPEKDWPAPGSIWWQVAHVRHCKAYYTVLIEQRGAEPERPPVPPFAPSPDFAAARRALEDAHAAQRVAIAALTDADLALKVGNGMVLPEFLAMAIRHDTWHAGQIAVARRLWRLEKHD